MNTLNSVKLLVLTLSFTIASCGGLQTFNDYALAGETVAVATGMQKDFSKNNITVTITPSSGPDIIYNAGDPAIRAIVNFYPDPLSSLIISRETDQDLTLGARAYAQTTGFLTDNDHDWFQTSIFIDLPATLPTGTTQIQVDNSLGDTTISTLEIIAGTGTPHMFLTSDGGGPLNPDMLKSLARVSHYTIDFDSATIPHAIEVNLSHLPDATSGGSGEAFAINPLGYKKNLSWTDDGTGMKAILLPSENSTISSMQDYKFYVAGGISGLNIVSVDAYDINGNVVSGVTATVTERN